MAAVCRFCEEFLRGLEPKTLASHSNLKAHVRNGTTSLPPRAQCVALEQIVATANATSLYRMLRRSLRREVPVRTTAARPLTRHSKTAIRTTCSRRKCLTGARREVFSSQRSSGGAPQVLDTCRRSSARTFLCRKGTRVCLPSMMVR